MAEWSPRSTQQWMTELPETACEAGIQHMTHFACKCYSPWWQCSETSFSVSFIQDDNLKLLKYFCEWTTVQILIKVPTSLQPLLSVCDGVAQLWYFIQNSAAEIIWPTFCRRQLKCIFSQKYVVSTHVSLKCVPEGPILTKLALLYIMAWCWTATSHNLNKWLPNFVAHRFASLGLSGLKGLKGSPVKVLLVWAKTINLPMRCQLV